jgi:HJR/Mrr/RecB family endonuclease
MPRIDDALERFWIAVATRSSGRAIAVVAVLLYGGIGLALPLILGWSVPWLVSANIIGTTLAGTLILVWLGLRVQAQYRRHLVEWTTDLRLLDAAEFEWLVGEVFRREGWQVEETGRHDGPDGNVDLRLTRDGVRCIVQCKRWVSWLVGVDEIRAFGGTLLEAGLPGTAGIFVTLSDFTAAAREHATKTGLTLLDKRDLYTRVERVRRAEACPKCHAAMVLDRSSRGWWFRCVTNACDGKRDLGKDPARAVELLTLP